MAVDYLPLVLLVLVLGGAVIVFRVLIRLKRAAVNALAEVRRVEAQLQSLQATVQAQGGGEAEGPSSRPDPLPPS